MWSPRCGPLATESRDSSSFLEGKKLIVRFRVRAHGIYRLLTVHLICHAPLLEFSGGQRCCQQPSRPFGSALSVCNQQRDVMAPVRFRGTGRKRVAEPPLELRQPQCL